MIEIRKGQAPTPLTRAEFSDRFRAFFIDPAFRTEDSSIARLEEIAWQAHTEYRKSPFTQKAGPGYADPDYELSTEWVSGVLKNAIDWASRPYGESTWTDNRRRLWASLPAPWDRPARNTICDKSWSRWRCQRSTNRK